MVMKMKKKIIAMLSALSLILSGGSVLADNKYSDEFDVFEQVAGYISTYYIDDSLGDQDIMNKAISKLVENNDEKLVELLKSMLSALDPYSEFFTAEEYKGFVNDINKTFYGIGVQIEQKDDYVEIVAFTPNSPSEKAGIQTGDKISKVDGADMKGQALAAVRGAILGELGTEVGITVLRGNQEYTYTIKRAEVNGNTVSYTKLGDKVGYVRIVDMSSHTADEFADALKSADSDGVKDIIIDLRGNVGGYLSCAIDIGQMIIPKGVIVSTKYRQSFMDKTYMSSLSKTKYNFNVLVDDYTASAAEILASAIQDSGAGKLIGERTYGKGVIQSTFPLSNGSVFKLTVGKYQTRNGHDINEKGIEPDEFIVNYNDPIDTSKYTPFTYKEKWSVGAADNNVKAAKERLYLLNYYDGDINDKFDEELAEAVTKFQSDSKIYPYGVLDITTQTKIENAFAKLEVVVDKQLDRAYEIFTGEPYLKKE